MSDVFSVIAKPQSYRNILYLLLGLPLGVASFTVLVTGVSVGLSMLVVALLGIPILIGLWYVVRSFMWVERGLAVGLLDVEIAPLPAAPPVTGGLWQRCKTLWSHGPTWKGFWYLLLRLPVGVATFTIAVTLVSTSLALAFAPVYGWTSDDLEVGGWTFAPYPWSFVLVPFGIALVFVSLHAMNALADVCGRWARFSLGGRPSSTTGGRTLDVDAPRPPSVVTREDAGDAAREHVPV